MNLIRSGFSNMPPQIKTVNNKLKEFYGIPQRPQIPPDPVDMLIATILSQNTNDRNSYKAYLALKEAFPDWIKAAETSAEVIEGYIKIAGLGKQKSKAIKNFLHTLLEEKGEISLNYLENMEDNEALLELTRFPGVGVKTASCVLQFALRRNICPVDTHVHRTVNRIGITKTSSPDKTFLKLLDIMPDNIAHEFHTNLIRLGREICKPAKPFCAICPIKKNCLYPHKNLSETKEYKENSFMLLDSIK
jgi:endonuclease III